MCFFLEALFHHLFFKLFPTEVRGRSGEYWFSEEPQDSSLRLGSEGTVPTNCCQNLFLIGVLSRPCFGGLSPWRHFLLGKDALRRAVTAPGWVWGVWGAAAISMVPGFLISQPAASSASLCQHPGYLADLLMMFPMGVPPRKVCTEKEINLTLNPTG